MKKVNFYVTTGIILDFLTILNIHKIALKSSFNSQYHMGLNKELFLS